MKRTKPLAPATNISAVMAECRRPRHSIPVLLARVEQLEAALREIANDPLDTMHRRIARAALSSKP